MVVWSPEDGGNLNVGRVTLTVGEQQHLGVEVGGETHWLTFDGDGLIGIGATPFGAGTTQPGLDLEPGGRLVLTTREAGRIVHRRLDPSLAVPDGNPANLAEVVVEGPRTQVTGVAGPPVETWSQAGAGRIGSLWTERLLNGSQELFARLGRLEGAAVVPPLRVAAGDRLGALPGSRGTLLSAGSLSVPWVEVDPGTGNRRLLVTQLNPDVDGDRLGNLDEAALGTDAGLADSDGDGLLDGFEVAYGFDPRAAGEAALDSDGDGLNNLAEQTLGTDPRAEDTDGGGDSDGFEVQFQRDPLDASDDAQPQ